MNAPLIQPPAPPKGSALWTTLILWLGSGVLFSVDYVLLSERVAADYIGPDPSRATSPVTWVLLLMLIGVTLFALKRLGRRLSGRTALGVVVGVLLGGALAHFVAQRYDDALLADVQAKHAGLPAAVQAYYVEHGQVPEKLSELVPAHLKQLPTSPEYCTRMELDSAQSQWALVMECNMNRTPREPHSLVFSSTESVHRILYTNHAKKWARAVRHSTFEVWAPHLRLDHEEPSRDLHF